VEADATQLRQVVMNLILNASEALEEKSGVIAVNTGARECDQAYLQGCFLGETLQPGLYVYLEVTDTGCGMDRQTIDRVFEPFFSTKFAGRGLGLTAVFGIVRGHRGAFRVDSEPGRGTTFRVLFPASAMGAVRKDSEPDEVEWKGSGTILVVDDEETVRTLGKKMVERSGFTALTACDGREAIEVFRNNADKIRCVILDLTMPHMDGAEAFQELRKIRSDIRVILSSGYDEQEVSRRFAGAGVAGVIEKPYTRASLVRVLRRVLESTQKA
jgi:CheY-like chemotaxis protein